LLCVQYLINCVAAIPSASAQAKPGISRNLINSERVTQYVVVGVPHL